MAVPRPALAWIAALALASAFVPPLRPQLLQLKPVSSSTARRRAPTLLRATDEPRSDNGTRDDEFDLEPRAAKDDALLDALCEELNRTSAEQTRR